MGFDQRDVTKHVSKDEWEEYFKTAKELFESAHDSFDRKRFRAAGIDAIHMAISAGDALMISYESRKATNHLYAASLLKQRFTTKQGAEAVKAYESLISMKTKLEYEGANIGEEAAKKMMQDAVTFFSFAESKVRPK
jgi:uncharacterized protein (UPF0332 family)